MRSQPENQKPFTVQLYKPARVLREMKWYFWKCNQRLTCGARFAEWLLFAQQPMVSADTLSYSLEPDPP